MIGDVPFSVLSASALLGLAVLFLLTGRLVPRSSLLDKIAEADRWRQAYETEREARQLADAQANELLELARTTHAVITSMASASDHLRGESNAVPET